MLMMLMIVVLLEIRSSAPSNFLTSSNFVNTIPLNIVPNTTQSSVPPSSSHKFPMIFEKVQQAYIDLCGSDQESKAGCLIKLL
jgi:hypothetical protein